MSAILEGPRKLIRNHFGKLIHVEFSGMITIHRILNMKWMHRRAPVKVKREENARYDVVTCVKFQDAY